MVHSPPSMPSPQDLPLHPHHIPPPLLADAFSGALSGAISRTITSPLDVIKIRFQVQLEPTTTSALWRGSSQYQRSKYTGILQATKDIIREEGMVGLWRGNIPALMMVMPYTSIQFMVLQKMKSFVGGSIRKEDQAHLSPTISFISGAVAGCAATVGSYPFDLLRTVLASQGEPKVYPNLRSAFFGILQARGIPGLYAGLTPTLIEIFPYAGIQFGSYDAFKRWGMELSGSKPEEESPFSHFTSGLAAGIVAKSFCHPLDVIKKRFQVEGLKRDPRYGANVESSTYKNVSDAIRRVLKSEGVAGFYKGLFPSLVKAAPASAITFVAYEFISDWLQSFLR